MNFLKMTLLFALALFVQVDTYSQEWVSYQSQAQINDLVDAGDELLMATNAGLVVMNKSTLEKTILNTENSNLVTNHIQSIAQAPDGSDWIGTYDVVLLRIDDDGFQDAIIPDHAFFNPESTMLYDFEIAPNGDLWLGTTDGIFHRENSNWFHYVQADLGLGFAGAWDIAINDAGDVFVGSSEVYKFSNGVWTDISQPANLGSYIGANLFFSSTGDLYFAGDFEYVGRFDGLDWALIDVPIPNGTEIKGFAEDTDGNIYLHSLYHGVFKLENDAWLAQDDAQVFNNRTSLFYIDSENSRWTNNNIHLSVNKNGAIQSTEISQYTIPSNNVFSIRKGQNGEMYFVTDSANDIAFVDSEGNWSSIPLPALNEFFEELHDVLFVADNDIWVGTSVGLYHYNGSEWTFSQEGACRSLDIDSQGKIYVQNMLGIIEIENGVIGFPSVQAISGLGVDANDNLWYAIINENTIFKQAPDGTLTTYTEASYPAIDLPEGDFHFDDNGNVWVASKNSGAIKFDGTTFTNPFTDNEDLVENSTVFSITNDASGKMYFAHQYGVTTLQDNAWEDLLIEDVSNELSMHSSKIKFDDNGTLWWGSEAHGIYSYTPMSTSTVAPNFEQANDFTIFPNPAVNYTTLDFASPNNATVNVFVYNGLGQLSASLNLGQYSKGNYQETIELGHLPKGIYTMQLKINNTFKSKSIIVQ